MDMLKRAVCLLLLMAGLSWAGEVTDWIEQDKVRGYWGAPLALIEPLHEAGLNTLVNRYEIAVTEEQRATGDLWKNYSFKKVEEDLLAASAKCKELGMRFFFCLDTGADGAIIKEGFRDNPRRGHDGWRPCPLDRVYWERVITARFVYAAKLLESGDYQLDGFIIDPEMYGFGGSFLTLPCYCDDCLKGFNETMGRDLGIVETAVEQRGGRLKELGMAERYANWQKAEFYKMARETRRQLEAINPDYLFGHLIHKDNGWFETLERAWSGRGKPVLVLPESTYGGACNDAYVAYQKGLKRKIPVSYYYVPGVSVDVVNGKLPEGYLEVLPGNLYHRTIKSDGYWVYASRRWGGDGESAKPFTTLFSLINAELDKYACTSGYESSWQAGPLPLDRPDNLQQILLQARQWKLAGNVPGSIPTSMAGNVLRGKHTIVVMVTKDEPITIDFHNRMLGNYTDEGRVILYDFDMRQVVDEVVPVNQTGTYSYTPVKSGPHVLVVSAGVNAFTVKIDGAPWCVHQERVAVNGHDAQLYFYIEEGREAFTVQLGGHKVETVSYRLIDPTGETVLTLDDNDRTVTKTIAVKEPGIWTLQVIDVVDDASVSVEGVDCFSFSRDNVFDSKN